MANGACLEEAHGKKERGSQLRLGRATGNPNTGHQRERQRRPTRRLAGDFREQVATICPADKVERPSALSPQYPLLFSCQSGRRRVQSLDTLLLTRLWPYPGLGLRNRVKGSVLTQGHLRHCSSTRCRMVFKGEGKVVDGK